jgi:hypothetical protein
MCCVGHLVGISVGMVGDFDDLPLFHGDFAIAKLNSRDKHLMSYKGLALARCLVQVVFH